MGRDFAFKASMAVRRAEEFRNIDFRNALRFLDVLIREDRLASEHDIDDVVYQIAAHLCRCATFRPLLAFAKYSEALTNVVRFITHTTTDVFKAAEVVRCLFTVLCKAKKEGVSLYDFGDASSLSLFVRREFQRETRWTGLYGYRCAAVVRSAHGKRPSECC